MRGGGGGGRGETDTPFLLMSSSTSLVRLAMPGGTLFRSFSLRVSLRSAVSLKNFYMGGGEEGITDRLCSYALPSGVRVLLVHMKVS